MPRWLYIILLALSGSVGHAQLPGLTLSLQSIPTKDTDQIIAQNAALYVPAGQSASPFLAPGKFQATWTGFISTGLRGDYNFQAELNGALKLEISNTVVLEVTGTNSTSALTKPIRLTKGANPLRATFTSPAIGDAFVRIFWKPVDNPIQPLPYAALTHTDTPELQKTTQLHTGRDLFIEHRCIKCHTADAVSVEFAVDAPTFEGLAGRRNPGWLAGWISGPKSLRRSARMPKIICDAAAVATYFASLATNPPDNTTQGSPDLFLAGRKVFEDLNCNACHIPPKGENANPHGEDSDPNKISLRSVGEKFSWQSLKEFLTKPNQHYAWIHMPKFRLTDEQLNQLANFLMAGRVLPLQPASTPELVDRGKNLLQTSGCLNCHAMNLPNKFTTKPLAQLKNLQAGCLGDPPKGAPDYSFAPYERDALRAWLAIDRASVSRLVPAEFATHQSHNLNCLNCHGPVDNIPPFEILGAKLRPEWSAKFIAGELTEKPRPWLDAQMPAFPKYAGLFAQGLTMQNGLPPQTPPFPPADKEMSDTGHKLVSGVPVGFGCIQCHAIGSTGALQVFEAPGINLELAGKRLQHSYFKLWVRRPSVIDMNSKMPGFFDDEGKSPLTQYYGGDGDKQIEAIWQALRL